MVSVSALGAQTLDAAREFCAELDARGVGVSLLVAPRLKGGHRLDADPETVDWLRARRDRGDALVLHGYDEAATKRRRAEFAVLPAHEANLRLMAADRVLDHLGLRTRLFAAPRWTASPGVVKVLPRNGFRLLIDDRGMTDLVWGTTERARLLGLGEAFLAEAWWCRTLVMSAERIARRSGTVRLAISARQLRRPGPRLAALDAVDLALLHGCEPAVYQWSPTRVNRAA
jgi:predicted deacetylase